MTPGNMDYFLSGAAGGAWVVADTAIILFACAGLWRWGAGVFCAVLGLMNTLFLATLGWRGADEIAAAMLSAEISVLAAIILLPAACVLAWCCWEFWKFVGGWHAQ